MKFLLVCVAVVLSATTVSCNKKKAPPEGLEEWKSGMLALQVGKPHNAVGNFRDSCNRGFAKGCHQLGIAYDTGNGVKKDPAMRQKYYSKACKLGHKRSCFLSKNSRKGR
ncbi:hypothetical protein KKF84_15855 [Myxococcota bacterium]|nr:hypothetical protein [Myxococcota bacterium]MBU1536800.1 hypothetical protein [Myxococcota bacterium]